jgi:hypothetical protein
MPKNTSQIVSNLSAGIGGKLFVGSAAEFDVLWVFAISGHILFRNQ